MSTQYMYFIFFFFKGNELTYYLGNEDDIVASGSGTEDPPEAQTGPVSLLHQKLLVVSQGCQELVPHVSSTAIGDDSILRLHEVLEVPPHRGHGVLGDLDLVTRLHLYLRDHGVELGPGQDLVDGEGQLQHLRARDSEPEAPLLSAGWPDDHQGPLW